MKPRDDMVQEIFDPEGGHDMASEIATEGADELRRQLDRSFVSAHKKKRDGGRGGSHLREKEKGLQAPITPTLPGTDHGEVH